MASDPVSRTETETAANLAELQQMCDSPYDGYTDAEWCFATNEAVILATALSVALEAARQERGLADDALDAIEVALFGDLHNRSRDKLETQAERLRETVGALSETLERIADNAEAWHGIPPDDSGHVRALAVITTWSRAALVRLRGSQEKT